jgi:hypothetical protein
MEDMLIILKRLFEDNWNPTNTLDITPKFTTGWYDQTLKDNQVTITDPTENNSYRGFSNNGPTEEWTGKVDISIWTTREIYDNPKGLLHKCKEEIKRIIKENYDKVTGIELMRCTATQDLNDKETKPVTYRKFIELSYLYYER